ncbi:MAG: hypothetical protein CFE23_02345 [Flavobacterium sp. BFFFF1]|uniref:hypothetical protein n=1 Tax=Flavobacterium sp. BFFFF1 TaxID=2015557 RepID=UPI000BD4F60F|nr:hypothetical protein [Flavobacterium sp. BFFFF1]OYU81745.1 MAG: hypothetical protein CFE23_02345 [Flavobacterium sp. BFFFF1]
MYNKKVIVGVAAGVAVLALVGILLAKKNKSKKQRVLDKAEDLADGFKDKLKSLKRRAEKEFTKAADSGEDFINVSKNRAADWVSKTSAS